MADEKPKKKGAASLYGKSPKIQNEPVDAVGDVNTSGHEEGAATEAKKPARAEGTMSEGGNAKGDVMAGTAGIPTHHEAHERDEMHARHAHERHSMHVRHEHEHGMREAGEMKEEHGAMNERHRKEVQRLHSRHESEMKEMGTRHAGESASEEGPSGGIKEKDVGKGGVEPKK